MTRVKALAAIDEAFLDAIKDAFKSLSNNVVLEEGDEAEKQFEGKIAKIDDAHSRAVSVVERIFPE